jgi:AcrR family transcriptional regulator
MPRAPLSQHEIQAFREKICRVATERFAGKGYAGVTLRGLAMELGCSPMNLYRYFRNKEEIFAAVRAAAFGRFADALEPVARAEPDPLERLLALGLAYLRYGREASDDYRIMFELAQGDLPDGTGPAKEEQRAWQVLRQAVQDAVRTGQLAGDTGTLAHILWASLHGLVALDLAGKLQLGRRFEDLSEPMLQTLRRGAAVTARQERAGGA